MKSNAGSHEWVYLHINSGQNYVLSNGIEFRDFYFALSQHFHHLLLLKHQYENASYNMHTHMEYVSSDEKENLLREPISSYGDFCWIDFEDEAGLDEMTAHEIAELLYLGHMKQHLRAPFFRKLNNQFVYLAEEDGELNRIYYRDWTLFYSMLSQVLTAKWNQHRKSKGLIKWKKEKAVPDIPKEVIMSIVPLLKEGAIISFQHASAAKGKVEIPLWLVGDYESLDDLEEETRARIKDQPSAWLTYERKSKEWTASVKQTS
ncbi:hypothetical protein [Jeotgalibacillus proteolyticus]|uniref:Oxalate:formate antiporter n=1 Tax=Jeotgalibacillus proteolyticus TaxID=2082395 RepID=A0A2S5GC28_9BACL|nr:hypothetical protein [Jeotgalibacillus proteolyticus]PPA70570.1 hypothetical protein C4B60_07130 [Jeotgalibacillus proteolyticus]